MKHIFWAITLIFSAITHAQSNLDLVHLKSGDSIVGDIQSIDESEIVLLIKDGTTKTIPANEVSIIDKIQIVDFPRSALSKGNSTIDAKTVKVPFAIMHKPPIFRGCDQNETVANIKKCTSNNLSKYVQDNFDFSIAKQAGLSGRIRIKARFEIDTMGAIGNIQVTAPHTSVEGETIRVLSNIPPMVPGQHESQKAITLYALPIVFDIKN